MFKNVCNSCCIPLPHASSPWTINTYMNFHNFPCRSIPKNRSPRVFIKKWSFRCRPMNSCKQGNAFATGIYQKLLTPFGKWIRDHRFARDLSTFPMEISFPLQKCNKNHSMRFAGDEWQFAINHPWQKSLLEPKHQLLLYVLVKSTAFHSDVHWSPEKTSPFLSPKGSSASFALRPS